MGVFIQIVVRQEEIPLPTAERITEVCPMDIFAIFEQRLCVQTEREDECTLCELCLNVAPAGSIAIHKSYKEEVLVSRAER